MDPAAVRGLVEQHRAVEQFERALAAEVDAAALLVYALRRLLLAVALLGVTLGVGYLSWNLLIG